MHKSKINFYIFYIYILHIINVIHTIQTAHPEPKAKYLKTKKLPYIIINHHSNLSYNLATALHNLYRMLLFYL